MTGSRRFAGRVDLHKFGHALLQGKGGRVWMFGFRRLVIFIDTKD